MTTKKTLSSKPSKATAKKLAKKPAPASKIAAKEKLKAKAPMPVPKKTKTTPKAAPAIAKEKLKAKALVPVPKKTKTTPKAAPAIAKEKLKAKALVPVPKKTKTTPKAAAKSTITEKAKTAAKLTPPTAKKTMPKAAVKPAIKDKSSAMAPTKKMDTKPPKAEKKDKKTPPKTVSTYKKTNLSTTSKISGIEKNNVFIPLKPSVPKITSPKKETPIKEVKIPKITAKETIPYNPGYTPLEKRLHTGAAPETFTKYSDNELVEFKELILRKLEAAKKELNYFQGLITRKDEQSGGTDEGRYLTMDDGGISMEREQLSQMASRAITYTDHLEKALLRIENKTYGICRVTGKLIDKARLRAVPHATLSYEAKQGLIKPVATNE